MSVERPSAPAGGSRDDQRDSENPPRSEAARRSRGPAAVVERRAMYAKAIREARRNRDAISPNLVDWPRTRQFWKYVAAVLVEERKALLPDCRQTGRVNLPSEPSGQK
jgi:hypothetical protein